MQLPETGSCIFCQCLHTNNIFKEGELDANSVVKEYLTTASADSAGKAVN